MKVYAHRGARGYAPENTMAAFVKAAELKADGIEMDVQLTADRQVVICHDHDIARTSNGQGLISRLTLKQLKQYDFGGWFGPEFAGETIPTLEEFLAWFSRTNMALNIEIKNGPAFYPGIEKQVLAIVEAFKLTDQVLISSFYHPALAIIKQLNKAVATAALFDCRPLNPLRFAEELGADCLHPHWSMVEPTWVQEAHARGIKVNAYTVNEKREYDWIEPCELDGIFSDFPDRFLPSL